MNASTTYSTSYSNDGFWGKLGSYAAKAGKSAVRTALILYYTLQKDNVPAWAKAVIIGALGYFICPIDAIPDVTPVIGYTDDMGIMAAAIASVSLYIDEDVKARADRKLEIWFG